MKTTLKIIAWTLTSLIVVVLITIAVSLWWVFTPDKITPVVQKQLSSLLTCETKVDQVELTFFSTFPEFTLHLHGFSMVQPMEGAPSDTLVRASTACATVDVKEFFDNNAIVVRELLLKDAQIMAYVDANGKANYQVMPPSEEEVADTAAFELPVSRLAIEKIELENSRIGYYDIPMKLTADLQEVKARMTVEGVKDLFDGKLHLQAGSMKVVYDSVAYLDSVPARISTAYSFELNRFLLKLPEAEVVLNELPLELAVMVENNSATGDVLLDIEFSSDGKLPVKQLLAMIPADYAGYMEGISLDGRAALKGRLHGAVNEKSLPHVALSVDLDRSSFAYEGLDYKLSDMSGRADIVLDLNNEKDWHIVLDDFDARTMNSRIRGEGRIEELMGDMRFDLKTNGVLSLADANSMLPDDMNMDLKGMARGALTLNFRLSQLMKFEFEKIMASGRFKVSDFYLSYDTITASTRSAELAFQLPNKKGITGALLNAVTTNSESASKNSVAGGAGSGGFSEPATKKANFINLHVVSDYLDVKMGNSIAANLSGVNLTAATSNLMDSTLAMVLDVDGFVDALDATMGEQSLQSGAFHLVADIKEDKNAVGDALKWVPGGYISFKDGEVELAGDFPELKIPAIEFDFAPDEFYIRDSRLVIDKSDFQLIGKLSNLNAYLNKTGLLKGDFNFVSSTTDVNYLMELMNGLGYEDTLAVEAPNAGVLPLREPVNEITSAESPTLAAAPVSTTSGPFLVPKGIDFTLNVWVNEAFVSTDVLSDVRGTITVKDGMLGLESVLFTSSAARMQLNALYHTPRRNHLFLGIDFHLTHIEIAELLTMIPDIDTIMPMLRSFGGRGEFHLAAETYLDSTYTFKPSTLRGVASVSGEDLVLMDGETFSEIAKTLMFNKKTVNKVDSLAAEFTIFKTEVEIYPFQIVMDKYKAVVSGKHNLDMNFNYHISLTDSPLPFMLGIDVTGNMEDMKFRPASPRYARLYRPSQRREIDRKQLEIKAMIRRALTEGL